MKRAPIIIGICGGSCSGKTYFANKLIEFQVPKREIAKIISSLNKEKVNKIYDSIKNL